MPNGDIFKEKTEKWKVDFEAFQKELAASEKRLRDAMELAQGKLPEEKVNWFDILAITKELPPSWQIPKLLRTGVSIFAKTSPFISMRGTLQAPGYMEYGAKLLKEEQPKYEQAITNTARSQWFTNFYSLITPLVASGSVTSIEDYIRTAYKGTEIPKYLAGADIDEARTVISNLSKKAVSQEDLPDFLKVEPEKAEEIRKFLTEAVKIPMKGLNRMTVEEIKKALFVLPHFPEKTMSDEEFLKVAALMDISKETLEEIKPISEQIKPIADALSEQERFIEDMLAGVKEWELPEMGFWERAKFTALQPMQVVADLLKPWTESVPKLNAGFVLYHIAKLVGGTQQIEETYDELRASGVGWYDAYRQAFNEGSNLNWAGKLMMEIILDPITWTPGLLLSGPAKITGKVGLKTFSTKLLAVNQALWRGWDLPFDLFKGFWKGFPKATSQMIRTEIDNFSTTWYAATTEYVMKVKGVVKTPSQLTVEDIGEAMLFAKSRAVANPGISGDVIIDYGRYLLQHKPIEPDDIFAWSKNVGGKLAKEDIIHTVVDDVNNILHDTVYGIGSKAENAKRLATVLMVEDSPKVMKKLVADIDRYTTKYATRIDRIIQIGKSTEVEPVAKMMEALLDSQKGIIRAFTTSTYWKSRIMSGFTLAVQRNVDKLDGVVWRNTIDRWAVRPMAEANLGNPAYPIWNAFEAMFVSAVEGVRPGMMSLEKFQTFTAGLKYDARLMTGGASDIRGMLNTMPGRAGTISFLPGKLPEKILGKQLPKWIAGKDWLELSGRKWIEFSDVWGNAYRRNFAYQRFKQHWFERLKNIGGIDVTAKIKGIVARPPIKIRKEIGISEQDMVNDMAMRVATLDKNVILSAKEMYSNGSLMRQEQLKILRQYDQISPRARTMGEEMVLRNEVMGKPGDNSSIINFAKTLTDESILDLKAYPMQAPDAFRAFASQIQSEAVTNVDALCRYGNII